MSPDPVSLPFDQGDFFAAFFRYNQAVWQPYRPIAFAAPLVWALIGSQAVFTLEVWEAIGLLVGGVVAAAVLFHSIREVKPA